MARRTSITDEQILEAARAAFLESGLNTTTAEIAERAGISEGSIFRRYDTKHELFLAAMGIPQNPLWMEKLENLSEEGILREQLEEISLAMLDFFADLIPKVSMIMACGMGKKGDLGDEFLPVRGLKALTHFFDSQITSGRIRRCDPEIVARMLVGSMHQHAFAELSGLNEILPMPRRTFVRGAVDNLLRGIAPAGSELRESQK